MKRLLALLLATLMVFSLVGCGNNTNSDNYSKLNTTDKIKYILGEKNDEGNYENKLIGVGFQYPWEHICMSDGMKESDFTEDFLKSLENKETIEVFMGITFTTKVVLKKMAQSELDNLDLEKYTKSKLENAEISQKEIADIPTYVAYSKESYTPDGMLGAIVDHTYFFVIKCDGYLAEFNLCDTDIERLEQLIYWFYPLEKSETNAENSESIQENSKLEILYNSYIKYTSIGEPIEGKQKISSSETNDDGIEIKRTYESNSKTSPDIIVTYNPDDNTITVANNPDFSWIVEFENNRPIRATGSDDITNTFTYNSEGNLIETSNSTYEYLNNGKIIKETKKIGFSGNIYEYEYDDNGFLISKTIYYNDDTSSKYYYENNSEGRMIKTYTKDNSGEIYITKENTYDENGYKNQ